MGKLEGKVALVTGASRGIGAAIARRFSDEGATVALNGRDGATLTDVGESLPGRFAVVVGDIADPEAAGQVVASTVDALGGLDIVVNNAGVTRMGPAHHMTDEAWDLVMDVNLRGCFNVCRAALRPLREGARANGHHAKIVNVGSTLGVYGGPFTANYSAAKAGMIGLTKSLAREWGRFHVNVNVLAPGFIGGTELTDAAGEGDEIGLPPELLKMLPDYIPVGRPGTPEDVAGAALFLAGPDSDYVTGSVLEAHGGLDTLTLPLGSSG